MVKTAFEEKLVEVKLRIYKDYINFMDDEFLAYEYNDRGLAEPFLTASREDMIEKLTEWCDINLFDDPDWIPDLEYKK